jgi:hypothetical protein
VCERDDEKFVILKGGLLWVIEQGSKQAEREKSKKEEDEKGEQKSEKKSHMAFIRSFSFIVLRS